MISKELQKEIFRRYSKHGFKFQTWKELIKKTKLKENKDPLCYYCKTKLTANFKEDKNNNVSLDHKQSKHFGGKNTLDNVVLCCHQCNIIKGTMDSETYFQFLEALEKVGLKEKVFTQMYPGRLAAMLNRKNKNLKLWELI